MTNPRISKTPPPQYTSQAPDCFASSCWICSGGCVSAPFPSIWQANHSCLRNRGLTGHNDWQRCAICNGNKVKLKSVIWKVSWKVSLLLLQRVRTEGQGVISEVPWLPIHESSLYGNHYTTGHSSWSDMHLSMHPLLAWLRHRGKTQERETRVLFKWKGKPWLMQTVDPGKVEEKVLTEYVSVLCSFLSFRSSPAGLVKKSILLKYLLLLI